MKKWLSLLDSISLAALIVTMCSQVDVRHVGRDTLAEGLGFATKTLKVALSDVVLLLVFLFFVGRIVQMKAWKKLWWPPLPCFALIFAMVISALHSGTVMNSIAAAIGEHGMRPHSFITKESKESIAEVVQWASYFLVAPWMFVNLLHDRRGEEFISRRNLALGSFVFAAIFSGFAALAQLEKFTASAPRGFFVSPNVYAAFLGIAIPLIFESESEDARTQLRYWILSAALLFIALCTITSPWALLAAGIGLFVSALARQGAVRLKAFRLALVVALAILTIGTWKVPAALQPYRADFTHVSSEKQLVKKQYIEWAAALGWSVPRERAFATGVGSGNYQLNIGPLYNSLPNEEKMPPDSNNLYLVQAVSIGALGLGSLLWVLAHFLSIAWQAARKYPKDWLGAGVVGALSSWLFVNLFHALIVRGAGLVLAFFFALAVIALEGQRNQDDLPKVKTSK